MRFKLAYLILFCCIFANTLFSQQHPLPIEQPVWTYTEYPSYVRQLTHFGERADWSHDGKKILFVARTLPQKLGTYCFEGPCVSRTQMKIAWTQNYGQEQAPTGRFVIWEADIDYSSGKAQLANQHMVIDNSHLGIEGAVLEVQNYRPPEEKEIIFQSTIGVETFGYNQETDKLANYSLAPETHEEPEGIYPDGKYTLVESDRLASIGKWATNVDFYKLALDGSGITERLSFFAESGKFRGTNPVVSDDGRYIAFQVSPSTAEAGVGIGIFLYDIEAAAAYE